MAEAVGTDKVHVTWEETSDGCGRTGFRVSYTPEGVGGTLSTGLGTSVYNYTVLGLHCNTAYIFTVSSIARDRLTAAQSKGVRVLVGGNYILYHRE